MYSCFVVLSTDEEDDDLFDDTDSEYREKGFGVNDDDK
jgi:hypothetical protein